MTTKYEKCKACAQKRADRYSDHQFSLCCWEQAESGRELKWRDSRRDLQGQMAVTLEVRVGGKMVSELTGWGKDEDEARQDAAKRAYFSLQIGQFK